MRVLACIIVAVLFATSVRASDISKVGDISIALKALSEKRPAEANAAFVKAALSGNAAIQGALGVMYNDGIGVPVDRKKAVYWLSKADEHGRPEASYRLGLARGNPEPEAGEPGFDRQASDQYFVKAWNEAIPLAQRRDAMAEATLARFLIPNYDSITDHLGIQRDPQQAESLLKDAVLQGDIDAMEMLASLYDIDAYNGRIQGKPGGEMFGERVKAALDLHRKAGLLGHSRAMERVGEAFVDGNNRPKAVQWLTAAAKLGDRHASTTLRQRYGMTVGRPFADTYTEPVDQVYGTESNDRDAVLVSMAIIGLGMAIALENPNGAPSAAPGDSYYEKQREEQLYWQQRQNEDDFACTISGGMPDWGGGCN